MTKWMLPALGLMAALACGQTVEEKETSQKTFTLSGSTPRRIEVDNVFGAIHVTGQPGDRVHLSLVQTIRADSKEKADQARREVKLDTSQENNTLRFFVDGPFRCKCEDGDVHFHGWRDRGYNVVYDFELKVPENAFLYLRTVNDGGVLVKNTAGDYDIRNVNGSVELEEVAGSGSAHTVNGRVSVTFRKNPQAACSFKTINGALDLDFQPGLSANLRLKTFNGGSTAISR